MFKVRKEQCDQCLFTRKRIVSLTRFKGILKDCQRKDGHFICHKATAEGEDACCKGFYDKNPMASNLMRIAHRLHAVEFV